MKYVENEIERASFTPKICTWTSPLGEEYIIKIPNTVYPPREDTNLLARTLMDFDPKQGNKLLEIGIPTGYHYQPNHLLKYYKNNLHFLPTTENIFSELLTLPMHPDISESEIKKRKEDWVAPKPRYERGYGYMYSKHIEQADKGCDFDFLRTDFGAAVEEPDIN